MQITIDQLDILLRLHSEIIEDGSLQDIYKGDHIAGIQDSLQDKEDQKTISRIELKLLQRLNAEIKGE